MLPLPSITLEYLSSTRSRYSRELIYERLMACRSGLHNDNAYAQMLATWYSGGGNMPLRLGLGVLTYQHLLAQHFPGVLLPPIAISETLIDLSRMPEREDLRSLLQTHCVEMGEEGEWVTDILVTGCMGKNHLWQDLGLWTRTELSALMQRNFPTLAAKNERDMKWKKFLYKQLCSQEGLYLCRAPSCEVCVDYLNCFGTEE